MTLHLWTLYSLVTAAVATYEIDTLDTLLSFKNFTAVWLNCVKTLQNANIVKIKGRKIVKKPRKKV